MNRNLSMSIAISVDMSLITSLIMNISVSIGLNVILSLSANKYIVNISMRMSFKMNPRENRKISANMIGSINECGYW